MTEVKITGQASSTLLLKFNNLPAVCHRSIHQRHSSSRGTRWTKMKQIIHEFVVYVSKWCITPSRHSSTNCLNTHLECKNYMGLLHFRFPIMLCFKHDMRMFSYLLVFSALMAHKMGIINPSSYQTIYCVVILSALERSHNIRSPLFPFFLNLTCTPPIPLQFILTHQTVGRGAANITNTFILPKALLWGNSTNKCFWR